MACAEGAEKFFPCHQKKFPKPRFSAALELRGEGGRGSRGEGSPPPLGMKIKASPWGGVTPSSCGVRQFYCLPCPPCSPSNNSLGGWGVGGLNHVIRFLRPPGCVPSHIRRRDRVQCDGGYPQRVPAAQSSAGKRTQRQSHAPREIDDCRCVRLLTPGGRRTGPRLGLVTCRAEEP